jgi:hypothetical protein
MDKGLMIAAAVLCPISVAAAEGDVEAVKAVVKSAYVEGVHVKADGALMRAGFHPAFHMLVLKDGVMTPVSLDDWAGRIEKGAAERKGPAPVIRHEFTRVDVTGDAAVVHLELYRDGAHAFTDYLSLYRFADGWKIVSKIFQAHPRVTSR